MNSNFKYKKYFLSILLVTSLFVVNAQTPASILDLTQYQNRIEQKNDTLYIVNFWATWCKPCVEELPYFENLANQYKNQNVKFILVSQDAKSRTLQVSQFMQKNKYTSEYFILSAGNPNVWIDKIEPNWSGTIPATIIYKNGNKKDFHEGDFPNQKILENFINAKL